MLIDKNHTQQIKIIRVNAVCLGLVFFYCSLIFVLLNSGGYGWNIITFSRLSTILLFSCITGGVYYLTRIYRFYKVRNMRYVTPWDVITYYKLDVEFARTFSDIMTKQGYEARVKRFNRFIPYECYDDFYVDILDENRTSILRCKCFKSDIDKGLVRGFDEAMKNSGYIGDTAVITAIDKLPDEDTDYMRDRGIIVWSGIKLKYEIDRAFGL